MLNIFNITYKVLFSADILQLKFPGMKFFLIHAGNWNSIFGKFLKIFA